MRTKMRTQKGERRENEWNVYQSTASGMLRSCCGDDTTVLEYTRRFLMYAITPQLRRSAGSSAAI